MNMCNEEINEFYEYLNSLDEFFKDKVENIFKDTDTTNIHIHSKFNYYKELSHLEDWFVNKKIFDKINLEDFFNFYFDPSYDEIKISIHYKIILEILSYISIAEEYHLNALINYDNFPENEDLFIQDNLEIFRMNNFIKFLINKTLSNCFNEKLNKCLIQKISNFLISTLKSYIKDLDFRIEKGFNSLNLSTPKEEKHLENLFLNKVIEFKLNEIFKDFINKEVLSEKEKMFLYRIIRKIFDEICIFYLPLLYHYNNENTNNFKSTVFNYFNNNHFKNEEIQNTIFEYLIKL